MKKNLKISKIDAVRRQLETAIRLYFSSGDPVAIHTLTAAAYNIMRDLSRQRDGAPLLVKDKLLEHVKPEAVKMLRNKLNEAENFFKHANRDHDNSLDFNPDQSETLIWDACSAYYNHTGEYTPLFRLYLGWYMANHPKIFKMSEEYVTLFAQKDIIQMGREVYFNTMLPLIMGVRT